MILFEFLIPKRPVSLQVRRRDNLRIWKEFVRQEALKTWQGELITDRDLQLLLVYLSNVAQGEPPVDTDNIIKPIQDALVGVVYQDDRQVTDIAAHRRSLGELLDSPHHPLLLMTGQALGRECVYVRVSESKPLEEYL